MSMVAIDCTSHAQEWVAAWNAHDLEPILARYADDVELVSRFVAQLTGESDGSLHGKAAGFSLRVEIEAAQEIFAPHTFMSWPTRSLRLPRLSR